MPGPRCTPRASWAPGEAVPFRSRLASPPPDGRDVQVRFFTRRDAVAERGRTLSRGGPRILIAEDEEAVRGMWRAR